MYNVTYVTSNNTTAVEELEVMYQDIQETSEYWCENQGYSSLHHSIVIPGKLLVLKLLSSQHHYPHV